MGMNSEGGNDITLLYDAVEEQKKEIYRLTAEKKELEKDRDAHSKIRQRHLVRCGKQSTRIEELQAQLNKSESEPTEFTKPYWDRIKAGESHSMVDVWREWLENCLKRIDSLTAENTELKDVIAKGFNEAAETLLKKLRAQLKAKGEEIARLRKLFICPNLNCKTDRYKQIHCHVCGAKFEQSLTKG